MSPLCRGRNGSCSQGICLPYKTPALLGSASCRTWVCSCNSLPNLCWPHTWQSQCTHPITLYGRCPDAYGHPVCTGTGASHAQPTPLPCLGVSGKLFGARSATMTPMPTHCEGRLGASISSCVSSIRPCLVISFTVCPSACSAGDATWPGCLSPLCLQGLTVPPVQKRENQGPPEEVIRAIMQDCYRNTMEPAAYWPGKYWLSRSEGTAKVPNVPLCHMDCVPMGLGD